MQSSGSKLDMNRTNVESLSVTADVSSKAFNSVTVFGETIHYEVTVELVKAWPKALDNVSWSSLDKNEDGWLADPRLQDVWRKWVLNEAGDYNNLRAEIRRPHDFSAVFGPYLQRRRVFEPCITLNPDGSPKGNAGGVYVEYYVPGHSDLAGNPVDAQWLPIDRIAAESRQISILDKECGIHFGGQTIPVEIARHFAAAKVRVTATIQSDTRANVTVLPPASLLKTLKPYHFDVGRKFVIRKRHTSSRFHGVVANTSARDDTAPMTAFAAQLLDAWNTASIAGNATLTGVDFNYSRIIGQTLSGIDGRDVDFNVAPVGQLYPTVISCEIDIIGQQTDLTLDTFRDADLAAGHFGAHSKVSKEM
jgi:hypothetical protein